MFDMENANARKWTLHSKVVKTLTRPNAHISLFQQFALNLTLQMQSLQPIKQKKDDAPHYRYGYQIQLQRRY